jgi:hypothetical protein
MPDCGVEARSGTCQENIGNIIERSAFPEHRATALLGNVLEKVVLPT